MGVALAISSLTGDQQPAEHPGLDMLNQSIKQRSWQLDRLDLGSVQCTKDILVEHCQIA